jgi:hypothetical protein
MCYSQKDCLCATSVIVTWFLAAVIGAVLLFYGIDDGNKGYEVAGMILVIITGSVAVVVVFWWLFVLIAVTCDEWMERKEQREMCKVGDIPV